MKFLRFTSFLFITLLVLLAEREVYAQWKNVAPNIVNPLNNSGWGYGAMKYQDGKLIAAPYGTPICVSSDDGKTWQLVVSPFPGAETDDIDIYDVNTAIISTYQNGLFMTRDGGQTWKLTNLTSSLHAGKFVGSANDIVAGEYNGPLLISHDGAVSWKQITPLSFRGENDVQVRKKDLAIFGLELDGISGNDGGHLYSTSDGGANWDVTKGTFYQDCYQFTVDPCSENTFYIMNEGSVFPGPDGSGHIFVSYDNGQTFTAINPKSKDYYSGNIVAAPGGTLYVQTQTFDGILRSTDRGITWKSIGGPSGFADTRLLCCKDDNTIFAFDRNGSIWATFNSGGDSLIIAPNGSLSIAPKSLFDHDTILCNDSITRSISINRLGCPPPSVSDWSVIGGDSLSYHTGSITADSLYMIFSPKTIGDHTASLIITINDGSRDTIELKGFNNSKPFSYSTSPQNLFGRDSIYICDPPRRGTFMLNTAGCLPRIVSQNITGKYARDYSTLKQAANPLVPLDSVVISFDPSDSGARDAIYQIIFDDGTIITIPLHGYGIAPHPLALTTADRSTDTLGGSINVPITITGLDHTEEIDLVLHYDRELTYHGSYSLSNVRLDLPSEEWIGRSKLHIASAQSDSILGYARFDVFNDSLSESHATFDSVSVLTAVSPCQYLLPAFAVSTITPPSGCGVQTISRFMHNGTIPELLIVPNPTSGEISIASTGDLGNVNATIYDMLGSNKGTCMLSINKSAPAKLALPVTNGVYMVRLRAADNTYDLRVVVNK